MYVTILRGHWNGRVLINETFPLVKDFTFGSKGWFLKVNGEGYMGYPQRNFKIFVESKEHAKIIHPEQSAATEEVETSEEPNEELAALDADVMGSDKPLGYISPASKKPKLDLEAALKDSLRIPPPSTPFRPMAQMPFYTPVPESNESDEEIKDRIAERFSILKEMSVAAARGDVRGLVVTGAPGVGKSHEVTHALEGINEFNKMQFDLDMQGEEERQRKATQMSSALGRAIELDDEDDEEEGDDPANDPDYVARNEYGMKIAKQYKFEVIKGHITPPAMFRVLYENRKPNDVVVFDDCDSALLDDTTLNLLKAALDSNETRRISWLTSDRRDELPSRFEFEGSVIFITNINFERTVMEGRSKLAPHLEAIMSRCLYLDLTIETLREKLIRIDYVCNDLGMLRKAGLEPQQAKEVLDWTHENAMKFRELSLRKVQQVAQIRKMGGSWQRVATLTILKGAR